MLMQRTGTNCCRQELAEDHRLSLRGAKLAESRGVAKEIIIGVIITVLGAIVVAMLSIGPDDDRRPVPSDVDLPVNAIATMCVTDHGWCELNAMKDQGEYCFCSDDYGNNFDGVAQ